MYPAYDETERYGDRSFRGDGHDFESRAADWQESDWDRDMPRVCEEDEESVGRQVGVSGRTLSVLAKSVLTGLFLFSVFKKWLLKKWFKK